VFPFNRKRTFDEASQELGTDLRVTHRELISQRLVENALQSENVYVLKKHCEYLLKETPLQDADENVNVPLSLMASWLVRAGIKHQKYELLAQHVVPAVFAWNATGLAENFYQLIKDGAFDGLFELLKSSKLAWKVLQCCKFAVAGAIAHYFYRADISIFEKQQRYDCIEKGLLEVFRHYEISPESKEAKCLVDAWCLGAFPFAFLQGTPQQKDTFKKYLLQQEIYPFAYLPELIVCFELELAMHLFELYIRNPELDGKSIDEHFSKEDSFLRIPTVITEDTKFLPSSCRDIYEAYIEQCLLNVPQDAFLFRNHLIETKRNLAHSDRRINDINTSSSWEHREKSIQNMFVAEVYAASNRGEVTPDLTKKAFKKVDLGERHSQLTSVMRNQMFFLGVTTPKVLSSIFGKNLSKNDSGPQIPMALTTQYMLASGQELVLDSSIKHFASNLCQDSFSHGLYSADHSLDLERLYASDMFAFMTVLSDIESGIFQYRDYNPNSGQQTIHLIREQIQLEFMKAKNPALLAAHWICMSKPIDQFPIELVAEKAGFAVLLTLLKTFKDTPFVHSIPKASEALYKNLEDAAFKNNDRIAVALYHLLLQISMHQSISMSINDGFGSVLLPPAEQITNNAEPDAQLLADAFKILANYEEEQDLSETAFPAFLTGYTASREALSPQGEAESPPSTPIIGEINSPIPRPEANTSPKRKGKQKVAPII
jgi:hypothetical protein